MAEMTESSSFVSSFGSSNFDVFLNFRGGDTRKNFTGFLHKALKNRAINVFVDSEDLWTGEAIGPTLLRAIEGSKISIPIFSKDYASSKWCLLELSHIVHCHKAKGQKVMPIFFDVEPTDVRNQTGSFQGPFRKHKKNFKPDIVKSWREALREIGNLKGWVLKEDVNGDQPELVELVVKKVFDELISSTPMDECEYPIGIEFHVENLSSILNIGSNDVQFIGICGFGGIGKTTIAKALYNDIFSSFNKRSFLSDIREATQQKGLASLQERLLMDILKTKDNYIRDYHQGKKLIEERLCKENVLLVLDDVDSQEQVDALAGNLKWFGPGSRIILTARDEHILNVAKVKQDKIYRLGFLDYMQSLRLFSFHAFSMDQPLEDYMQFSHDVVCYSQGLPLTLKVLGSNLSDIREKEVWESTLQKLEEIPPEEVHRRLKISYDNLDGHQKAIFLDAACFFIGWEKETVISIWEACGYYPKSVIHRLIKKSLLKFELGCAEDGQFSKYYLKMHDHIRDMGRAIVLEESLTKLGKRSRIWSDGEISQVLKGHMGSDMIEGMILPFDLSGDYLNSKHFEMMFNLRFLDISSTIFTGELSCLPFELRWLRLKTHPSAILSTNFYHERLVYLDLSGSSIKQAWNIRPRNKNKWFQKLKVLKLRGCIYLSESPHFSWFPYLEELDLWGCRSLGKLNESVGRLSKLRSLILSNCWKMKELPSSIGNLTSLVELQLSNIKALPDGVGLLQKLEILNADSFVAGRLVKLPRSMRRMKCLRSIYFVGTNIPKFPNDFATLQNLEELEISPRFGLIFENAGPSRESLDRHEGVEFLPELPSSLVKLHCIGCRSLVQLPDLSRLKNLRILSLSHCINLEEIGNLEGTESLEELNVRGCSQLTYTPRKTHGQGTLLSDRSQQNRYSLTAKDGINNKGLILCLVFKPPSEIWFYSYSLGSIYIRLRLEIVASICQKDRTTRCFHFLDIEDIEVPSDGRDIIYIHHFKGFDWFGIPLQGKDSIEILNIHPWNPTTDPILKFWKVLFKNRKPDPQKHNQHSSAMMVADFFTWSYVNGISTGGVPSLNSGSQTEVERSNSVVKKVEEEEGVMTRASDCQQGVCVDDEALNHWSNQQTLDQPSHIQENGIILTVVNQILELFRRIRQFFGWR